MDTYGKVPSDLLNRHGILAMTGFLLNDGVCAHRLVLLSGLVRAVLHAVGGGYRRDSYPVKY